MPLLKKQSDLLPSLILMTSLFVIAQILFLVINAATTNLFDTAVATSITTQILHSRIFIQGFLYFIASQVLLYSIFVGLVWYLTVSVAQLYGWRDKATYRLGIFLLLTSIIATLAANNYFVPNSFFSLLIKDHLFNGHLTPSSLEYIFSTSISILIFAVGLATINLCFRFYQHQHQRRDQIVLLFLTAIILFIGSDYLAARPQISNIATATKPNVIIIGIDALRPDFVGFYNPTSASTPHIDEFLRTGSRFAAAYTPLPRTFPSWTGILTGDYPKHSFARGNNTDLAELELSDTLPKKFQAAGYETIYGTDDTRFNNTNELFGFDKVVTPPMGLNDFLIGTLNDFPLSNLIIPTAFGRLLFPYNYANHGTAITYLPANFLQLLNKTLHQRQAKPLFMAVHFTITHWPFYWFNSQATSDTCDDFCRYKIGISKGDQQFADFMHTLQNNGILDHALVILLSDHGVAMGLHGDRPIRAALYQGDNENIKKIPVFKYADTPKLTFNVKHDFGIDTSYGYGGDVLSLVQAHSLLAFKGFGLDIGNPHTIADRVLLIDIAPTILDLLHLPALQHADGISLKPYLFQQSSFGFNQHRPFFFESSFTLEEIEHEGISVTKVLAKTAKLYRMDTHNGLVFIKSAAEKSMSQNKQHAIMQGDWLLAHYPAADKMVLVPDKLTGKISINTTLAPPFLVLVNLRTGKWTTELNTPFARTAPVNSLLTQLQTFYPSEIMF